MISAHLFFSHTLQDTQKKELKDTYGVTAFTALPEDLQHLWSNVPAQLPSVANYASPLIDYLSDNSRDTDIVFVQGDFGLTYYVVSWCIQNGRVPVYASTQRRAEEVVQKDGTVELRHMFRHVRFREYEGWSE
ncbi:CRISPR-associated protein Csx20 [Chitinivibrio alkaliphilus]|uniref:CRISPR-associated protein n=1 Tax=Chitinivibrio alkaliphilus ACht1 TaxID=1313304 RepID=U7D8M0_9BACT|nr:CRISPR-associated protein Csx20 [Chitinivibrio alkaliphilus]ERP30780.1 hypothetical protein CALK_2389 [Chitinivibrio alkaliphilus ACht1]